MRQQKRIENDISALKRRRAAQQSATKQTGNQSWHIWWEIPLLIALTGFGLQTLGFWPLLRDALPVVHQQFSNWRTPRHTFGPSHGVFPEGCKWREVLTQKEKSVWDKKEYEFWDFTNQTWTDTIPEACLLDGESVNSETRWEGDSPRTQVFCDNQSCIYQNLWYNSGRWFLLIGDGMPPVDWWMMTRYADLHPMHVKNVTKFVTNVEAKIVRGDSLFLDFIFFMHPTAIGHWGEMLYPLFSILRNETDFKSRPDRMVLLNVKRGHMMEWVREVLAVALSIPGLHPLPPVVLQRDQADVNAQIREPLEGVGDDVWLCFERALVVRDHIFAGGSPTFLSQEDAHAFRTSMYTRFDLPAPSHGVPPRKITFQRKSKNRRILNEREFLKLLSLYGEVEVVEFTERTPFRTQLEVMARTGVLISVHTSALANAQFLQPGSAVFEIVQRNWGWADMDQFFKVQTEKMGDIHHYAWRAQRIDQVRYLNPRDAERFVHWGPEDCSVSDCVEAHTEVDVIVDLQEFKALLDSRLPLVFNGTSVEEAALPWPRIMNSSSAHRDDYGEDLEPNEGSEFEDVSLEGDFKEKDPEQYGSELEDGLEEGLDINPSLDISSADELSSGMKGTTQDARVGKHEGKYPVLEECPSVVETGVDYESSMAHQVPGDVSGEPALITDENSVASGQRQKVPPRRGDGSLHY